MTSSNCPTEEELYSLLAGDEKLGINRHVETCTACRDQLQKLKSEDTFLRSVGQYPQSHKVLPTAGKNPGVIGKFIVVGTWDDNPLFVTYRGLHAVVRQDVLLQVAKSPRRESGGSEKKFESAYRLWMQPRTHSARLLEVAEFESRSYLVIEFNDETRLDRLACQKQIALSALMQIFGKIAKSFDEEQMPHPLFQTRSVVVDEADNPTIVDWSAANLFSGANDDDMRASVDLTIRRFARSFCEAVLVEMPPSTTSDSSVLINSLMACSVRKNVAEIVATAATWTAGPLPSFSEIANALLQKSSRPFWHRLFGR